MLWFLCDCNNRIVLYSVLLLLLSLLFLLLSSVIRLAMRLCEKVKKQTNADMTIHVRCQSPNSKIMPYSNVLMSWNWTQNHKRCNGRLEQFHLKCFTLFCITMNCSLYRYFEPTLSIRLYRLELYQIIIIHVIAFY